jgi:hypothetical protein
MIVGRHEIHHQQFCETSGVSDEEIGTCLWQEDKEGRGGRGSLKHGGGGMEFHIY